MKGKMKVKEMKVKKKMVRNAKQKKKRYINKEM